ncbi:uncharacterized protein LOC142985076 isoform X21 [Anticarsia gemmatalis]|uniref:uncharacterized protein LOC142985076 isoform X21 n=1 Tax=Anticarsia gemmatalis TaxID=129554 RepID=UPI003F770510
MDTKSSEWRPGPTVCRCCLTEGCYKDISTEYFWMGKREVYSEMLSDTFNVTIAYSQSGGPNSNSRLICEPCISRLRDACDFRRQVLECEKTFMQHLDPCSSRINDLEVPVVPLETDVKLERIKLETSDDDEFDDRDFDDDDDDMDDQPLTKLASKIPKKETVDILDLLDNNKAAEKRKSATKTKTAPAKKAKIVKKEPVKATASKVVPKTEKKKKDLNDLNNVAKRNAEFIVKYSTVFPFKLPEDNMNEIRCSPRKGMRRQLYNIPLFTPLDCLRVPWYACTAAKVLTKALYSELIWTKTITTLTYVSLTPIYTKVS